MQLKICFLKKFQTLNKSMGGSHTTTHAFLHCRNLRKLFQHFTCALPQSVIVPLQIRNFIRIEAAVGICMDGRLIEVVGAAPKQENKFFDRRKVYIQHIAV